MDEPHGRKAPVKEYASVLAEMSEHEDAMTRKIWEHVGPLFREFMDTGRVDGRADWLKRRSGSPRERMVKQEIIWAVYLAHGRNIAATSHALGVKNVITVSKYVKEREEALKANYPALFQALEKREFDFHEQIFEGREDVVNHMNRIIKQALNLADGALADMRPIELIKTAAIFTDKTLLLTGQPTSRVARTDERMQSTEDLKKKLEELRGSRKSALQVVEGGKREASQA